MKRFPIMLILQVCLLVGWYTVAPGLPWWLVFLPALVWLGFLAVVGICLLIAGAVAVWGR